MSDEQNAGNNPSPKLKPIQAWQYVLDAVKDLQGRGQEAVQTSALLKYLEDLDTALDPNEKTAGQLTPE